MYKCQKSDISSTIMHNTFFEIILCPECKIEPDQIPFSGNEKRTKEQFIEDMRAQGVTYESLQKEKEQGFLQKMKTFISSYLN